MEIDFEKSGGLVPAIVQDAGTRNVLMLGYMNEEAYRKTIETKKVTFFSRSRQKHLDRNWRGKSAREKYGWSVQDLEMNVW